MKKNSLHKNSTKQSQQQDKQKNGQQSDWVEEIKKSFNKNRTKRIAVA
ncbi:MAG TPA: hypothetical protein VE090_02075 [Methylomirabilota bacterium]|nr:hypothetical protein [Methylomirabilota bacterium]